MHNQFHLRVEWMADRENKAACISNNFTDMGELLLYREARLPAEVDLYEYPIPSILFTAKKELLRTEKELNQMLKGALSHQNGIIFWSF